jgi:hypothetical protein
MTLGSVLIVLAVLVAALFCPALMWFQSRRGRPAPCCPHSKGRNQIDTPDLGALRRRQEEIEAQLGEADGPAEPASANALSPRAKANLR